MRRAVAVVFAVVFSCGIDHAACAADQQYAFIYYANETSLQFLQGKNTRRLLDWLSHIKLKSATDAVDKIDRDASRFSATVKNETSSIERVVPPQFGVAILTNDSVLDGHYLLKLPNKNSFENVAVDRRVRAADPRLDANPLDDPLILRSLLSDAVRRASPDKRPVILVVKSHGNESFALMPRSFVDTTRTSLTGVRNYLARYEATGIAGTPRWLMPVGITKRELMADIETIAENQGVQFDVVVLEACKSGIGLYGTANLPDDPHKRPFLPWNLPRDVRAFVSGGPQPMEYSNLNYVRLFHRAAATGDLPAAFLVEAKGDGLTIQKHWDYWFFLASRYELALWFAPLAIWLAVMATFFLHYRKSQPAM